MKKTFHSLVFDALQNRCFCVVFATALFVMPSSSQAHLVLLAVNLNGQSEVPTNTSLGFGNGFVTLDLDEITMRVQMNFSGLTGTTTAAAIHAATSVPFSGTAGIATQLPTFTGFPAGVTAGSYDRTFDLALAGSYNPNFIAANGGMVSGALNALVFAAEDGKAYFSIKTIAFPQGEIRGFLVAVPEPSSLIFAGIAVVGLALWRWRNAGRQDLDLPSRQVQNSL